MHDVCGRRHKCIEFSSTCFVLNNMQWQENEQHEKEQHKGKQQSCSNNSESKDCKKEPASNEGNSQDLKEGAQGAQKSAGQAGNAKPEN